MSRPIRFSTAAMLAMAVAPDLGGGAALNRALALDHQDASFADGVRNMLVASLGNENVRGRQANDVLVAVEAIMHIDMAAQYDKRFGAIVFVPDVGLIGPVEPDGRTVDLDEVASTPGAIGSERGSILNDHHASFPFSMAARVAGLLYARSRR